jgi:hypothetical protein
MDETSGRHPVLVLLVGSLLMTSIGCDPGAAAPGERTADTRSAEHSGPPTVVVDSAHEVRENGAAGQPYLLAAAPGLVLDASRFKLNDPHRRARMPNSVQIIYEKSLFTAGWPVSGRQVHTLDRSTLTRVRGTEFEGFRPGTQAYIAIGHYDGASTVPDTQFTPFWITSVVFR